MAKDQKTENLPEINTQEEQKNVPLIVVVDDDLALLELMEFSLKPEGFRIHTISSGKDALKYFSDEKNIKSASLLILDRILPDLDGIEILKHIQSKNSKHFPVLILSLLSSEKDVLTGLSEGAIDYIVKPFNLKLLKQKTHALLALYRS